MHARRWMTGLTLGTMALTAMLAVNPIAGSAQETTTDQANGPAVVGAPLLQPKIDMIQAQEIALADQSGAVVTDVSLEGESGVLAYSVELDNGNEVHVDADSGDILPDDGKDEDGNENENEDQGEDDNGQEDGSEGDDQD